MQFWISDCTMPAVSPATIEYTGLEMKKEAEPTTMPPAMGACMMSRMIKSVLMKTEMLIAPTMEAPIPKIIDTGPVVK